MPELKQEIRLWVSSGCGNQKNCRYPYEKVVSTTEDLKTAVAFDHTFISFKSNYRNEDNFEFADALAVDCDNGHTDEKDKWIRSDDIAMAFPDVSFVIYTSRNHMKDKGSSVARPRFHVIFFIDRITSAADYKALLKRVQDYFPYFDTKALDAARFFYGNADCEITVQEGNTNLTQFFSEEDAFANMGEEIQEGSRNASMFKWAVRSMKRYGNTEESKKCFYLQAEKCNPPLDDEELQTIWRSAARYYKKIASQPDYVPPQEYNNPGPTKWVEPIPFRKYKMEEFPVDALPADLADYVIEASESTQTPVDMAGTVAISMLSTCE